MGSADLRAGWAQANVTPERSIPLFGYYGRGRVATGVHDPLSATALVLSEGATTVGVVSVDLLLASAETKRRVEARLAERDVVLDALVLAATHTHSGPHLPPEVQDLDVGGFGAGDDEGDEAIREAFERIETGIVESVVEAAGSLAPATVRAGRTEVRDASMNRRSWGGHLGNVATRPDADPDADVDPELTVLDVERDDGERAAVVNFACHPLSISRHESLLTADYPGVVYERLADERDATTLFVNGAAGDIAPARIYDWDARLGREFEYLAEVGDRVATAALDALDDAADGAALGSAVAAETRDLTLPLRETDRTELEAEHRRLTADVERLDPDAGYAESIPPSHQALVTRKKRNRTHVEDLMGFHDWKATRGVETTPATLTRLRIGEASLLTLPGEPFVRHGLDLKAAADADPLVVAGYANGHLGYLPTDDDFHRSGYEVQTCRLAPDAVGRLRAAAFDLVS
jgi:hypothetical protein